VDRFRVGCNRTGAAVNANRVSREPVFRHLREQHRFKRRRWWTFDAVRIVRYGSPNSTDLHRSATNFLKPKGVARDGVTDAHRIKGTTFLRLPRHNARLAHFSSQGSRCLNPFAETNPTQKMFATHDFVSFRIAIVWITSSPLGSSTDCHLTTNGH